MLTPFVADALFAITAAIYLIASSVFLVHLLGKTGLSDRAVQFAARAIGIGAVFHAGHIVVASLVLHVCPVEGMHFAMSVVSMLACIAYAFARLRYKVDLIGAFVGPFALTFLVGSRAVAERSEFSPRFTGAILPIHIATLMLGYALFTLAFGAAVLYLVQERRLKNKQLGSVGQRLPPLDALDKAELRFLLFGFPFLTIGILAGTVFARSAEVGSDVSRLPALFRAILGYLTWLIFALVLLLRVVAGWRGRRAAYGIIAGFVVAMTVMAIYLLRTPPVISP